MKSKTNISFVLFLACTKLLFDCHNNIKCNNNNIVTFSEEKSKNIFINAGTKLRVAYQGVPGAYSEAAAIKAYPNCELFQCERFEDTFKAAGELWGGVDRAVIPIENSVGGSIHRNYDLLVRHHQRLHIVGEIYLSVHHCLVGLPGVRKEDLTCIFSHPQALDQCEMSLQKLGVARLTSTNNTAGAAKIVASERVRENGAIASARAAEIYGLQILAHNFQDASNNITRFLLLSREPATIPSNVTLYYYKTSIVFTLKEGPGVFVEALAVFALRGINLSKIESRPLEKNPLMVVNDSRKHQISNKCFDYFFYIDFEASVAEPQTQYALQHLQEFTKFFRILGCYPMHTTI
ncbi:hypothetical protein ACJIZ3_009810 [Penstemon smallii]|uniref:Arogenate dehydratase n=1 Tax=Penstemon smallii TaxID=265156 RepID=A0ABD3TDJ4_9LAMI